MRKGMSRVWSPFSSPSHLHLHLCTFTLCYYRLVPHLLTRRPKLVKIAYLNPHHANELATLLPSTASRSSTSSQLSIYSSTVGSNSEMAIGLRNLKGGDSQSGLEDENTYPQDDIRSRSRSRYIWTGCAAVSLLSSKYLMVDLNVHCKPASSISCDGTSQPTKPSPRSQRPHKHVS